MLHSPLRRPCLTRQPRKSFPQPRLNIGRNRPEAFQVEIFLHVSVTFFADLLAFDGAAYEVFAGVFGGDEFDHALIAAETQLNLVSMAM